MKTILVVDDDEINLHLIGKILNHGQYQFFTATDGCEAFKIFNTEAIDLVLTDYNMPNMDGLELLKKILELDPEKPVVLMSACTDAEADRLLRDVHRSGGAGFIQKPFRVKVLKNIVRFALEKSSQKALRLRRLCDDSSCEKDCAFCLRIQQTDSREALHTEKKVIEEAIETNINNEEWESITDLSKKQKVIRRKLYARAQGSGVNR